MRDAEGNVHGYSYYSGGILKDYTEPNGSSIRLLYSPEANWLQKIVDTASKITEFKRDVAAFRSPARIRPQTLAFCDAVGKEIPILRRLHAGRNEGH